MSSTGYYQFNLRTVVHSGAGSAIRLPSLFEGLGAKRVVLLSDAGLKSVGLVDRIVKIFETSAGGNGVQLAGVFTDIAPDAACSTVNAALAYARSVCADSILALGGGSVLDASKGVKYAMAHDLVDIREVMQTGFVLKTWPQEQHSGVPHIGVPTTAGTGAEVSPIAVFYNEEIGLKANLLAPYLEPDMAVLDAKLTLGLPPSLTAATGMDALTHAFEAVASPNANAFTDAYGTRAAQIIQQQLPVAVKNGKDVQARSDLLQASTMAIAAFSGALGAIPVHNCAHAFGAMFHIPHGDANSALLPVCVEVLPEYYLPNAHRLATALNVSSAGMSDEAALDAVKGALRQLQADTGATSDFKRWGVDMSHAEKVVHAILTDAAALFFPIPVDRAIEIVRKVC